MSVSIKPVDPVSRPFFAGEASGIDITRPLSGEQVGAIALRFIPLKNSYVRVVRRLLSKKSI